jgi:hypothetical protein
VRRGEKLNSAARQAGGKAFPAGPKASKHQSTDPHVRLSERPKLPDAGDGRFGRLFPELTSQKSSSDSLLKYGASGGPLEAREGVHTELGAENPRIPAGWPFFGQFIAHDVTHDRSPLREREDIGALQNFRSPRLDLECVYGAGPVGQPYLYDVHDPDKFLITRGRAQFEDLPRNPQGVALVGDARNDTHLFVSQLQLAFLRFHNRVVDLVRGQGAKPDDVFARAQRIVRWHYQWIIVHEFLPLHIGNGLAAELLRSPSRLCRFRGRPFIPVEFSDGAYRFGHAQVRAEYDVNSRLRNVPLFPDLVGIRRITGKHKVDWSRLFALPGKKAPSASRRIGARLAPPLMRLPQALVGSPEREEFSSLASRDLYRGHSLDLPSGESIARAVGVTPCTTGEPGPRDNDWHGETPLWLYILIEAEVQQKGEQLGEIGGRIVGEVLIELLRHDPTSFFADSAWRPELAGPDNKFGIADLLEYAGVA